MAMRFWAVIYLSAITLCTFASAQNELVISEYIEGSSFNKAIELCNPSSSAVTLVTENYVLQVYNNGVTSPSSTISLSGTVPAGGSFVISHTSANAGILAKADQTSGNLDFNGNDVVILRKGGATGTVVDSFGQVGTTADFAKDKTYRKKSCGTRDVVTTDAFNRTDLYNEFAVDTIDGLKDCPEGCAGTVSPTASPTSLPTALPTPASPTASPTAQPTGPPNASPTALPTASPTASLTTSPTASPTTSPTASPTASPTVLSTASPTESVAATDLVISEYIEGTSFNKVIELCNPSSSAVNLTTANYVLQTYNNGVTSPTFSITLIGTVPAGGSFVIAHSSAAAGILSNADQTSSFVSFNGDDAVVLRKGGATGTVVDSFGQVGNQTDFGTNKTYRKKSCGVRDVDTTDLFNGTVLYDEFAVDTIYGLNNCPSDCEATVTPTDQPTATPTYSPSSSPTLSPTTSPTASPTVQTTNSPTAQPTRLPTKQPTRRPTTAQPTRLPTEQPTRLPTEQPTRLPTTAQPTGLPTTAQPTGFPTTARPTGFPTTARPTGTPTTAKPTRFPTTARPTGFPTTARPTGFPTTARPTGFPTTARPTLSPTASPTSAPTTFPTASPTSSPTSSPTTQPTAQPTESPTTQPTAQPTEFPTTQPTAQPTEFPTTLPTAQPTKSPTRQPTTKSPTRQPTTKSPTRQPTAQPTAQPTKSPTI